MITRCLPPMAAVLLAASFQAAVAQPASAPAAPGIAATSATTPLKKPLSPTELRESASQPGDLRPENPVKPQISIPLGKPPVSALTPEPRAQRRIGSALASAGVIDDASARCEAEAADQARDECRRKLAQANPRR